MLTPLPQDPYSSSSYSRPSYDRYDSYADEGRGGGRYDDRRGGDDRCKSTASLDSPRCMQHILTLAFASLFLSLQTVLPLLPDEGSTTTEGTLPRADETTLPRETRTEEADLRDGTTPTPPPPPATTTDEEEETGGTRCIPSFSVEACVGSLAHFFPRASYRLVFV